jgi:uncharacterized protein (TIGR02147 family)
MADDWAPDIFVYSDYRKFLADYYAAAKEHHPAFSYRYFARRAGYTSPNFLKLVIDGQRNLSSDSVDKFARALKLTPSERRFFGRLVAFNQAETQDEKNQAWERVSASHRFRKARRLDRAYFEYLSRWYNPAIREMAARADFREDPQWIAQQLVPPIQPSQAQACLELLLELGLLVRDDTGRLQRGQPSLTTGHEVTGLGIRNYHAQMLERARESMTLVPADKRDISALTVCVQPGTVPELKRRIHEFREVMLDRCDRDEDGRAVYQLTIQLFPLTKVDE